MVHLFLRQYQTLDTTTFLCLRSRSGPMRSLSTSSWVAQRAAVLVASVAKAINHEADLVRSARWVAALGGLLSPALLTSDLGVPAHFEHAARFQGSKPHEYGSVDTNGIFDFFCCIGVRQPFYAESSGSPSLSRSLKTVRECWLLPRECSWPATRVFWLTRQ